MDKNKKVPYKAKVVKGVNKVPQKALILTNGSTDDINPVFSFKYTDPNKWQLSEWTSLEIDDLFKFFKLMESLSWKQVKMHSGLRYKNIDGYPNINNSEVSEDVSICELRICKVKRIHGFRSGNVFCVIWFDRDHSVCPEGKNRTYGT